MDRYLKFALPILIISLLSGVMVSLLSLIFGLDPSYPMDYVIGMFVGGLVFRNEVEDDK